MVVAHEVGHTLGLEHSPARSALMSPYYKKLSKDFVLSWDDILAIQNLYGEHRFPKTSVAPGDVPWGGEGGAGWQQVCAGGEGSACGGDGFCPFTAAARRAGWVLAAPGKSWCVIFWGTKGSLPPLVRAIGARLCDTEHLVPSDGSPAL